MNRQFLFQQLSIFDWIDAFSASYIFLSMSLLLTYHYCCKHLRESTFLRNSVGVQSCGSSDTNLRFFYSRRCRWCCHSHASHSQLSLFLSLKSHAYICRVMLLLLLPPAHPVLCLFPAQSFRLRSTNRQASCLPEASLIASPRKTIISK